VDCAVVDPAESELEANVTEFVSVDGVTIVVAGLVLSDVGAEAVETGVVAVELSTCRTFAAFAVFRFEIRPATANTRSMTSMTRTLDTEFTSSIRLSSTKLL
jgi:hypothetical protein